MARPGPPKKRAKAKRPSRFVTLSERLLLASFACACGAEIEIAADATLATDIVCIGCGEWIGVYAELLPAPAPKRHQPARGPRRRHARR
ncbi:MAG TPA: hypothetical protein VHY80_02885 [Stellaceae bacterium]|nr:hypothetical protein [Stellaceae bacterium]